MAFENGGRGRNPAQTGGGKPRKGFQIPNIPVKNQYLIRDDFKGEDNWLNAGGASHSIDTEAGKMLITGLEGVVYYPKLLSGDFTFEFRYISSSGVIWTEPALFNNGQAQNGLLWITDSWYDGNGSWSHLKSESGIGNPASGSVVKLKKEGNNITISINGEEVTTCTYSRLNSGYIGFRTELNWNFEISDVKVYR